MRRSTLRIVRQVAKSVLVLTVMAAGYCGAPAWGQDNTVKDASGRTVTIRDASRIVSIGGAITEILYALGLQQRIVAVDSTSVYPPQAVREKPSVGYMRRLSPEG